jgi:hypothetical protein
MSHSGTKEREASCPNLRAGKGAALPITERVEMKKRIRATWVSRKERRIWCCDFSGFEGDRPGLVAEIEASQAVIQEQPDNSMLVAVDLCHTNIVPEIAAFFEINSSPTENPIHKMAIIGVSSLQRFWYQRVGLITWPKNARFFDDWEKAKDWLVGEGF